jgi:aminoglycoside/choline kinase family phosphotransferase
VVKEPRGSTRTGTAGAGLREVSLYRSLTPHLPLRVPDLLASHPMGSWMVLDMLPRGRKTSDWKADDYLLAIELLVSLHDRFWNLSDHLIMYTWLARPLTSDYKIHIRAAEQGLQNLRDSYLTKYLSETKFMNTLDTLVENAEQICTHLSKAPKTLLHGDYWPGNIRVHEDGTYTVFDWQEAAIGFCMIDLIDFITSSCWWCVPLPISPQELVKRYRKVLRDTNGFSWKKDEWIASWDYSAMWVFLFKWIGLLNRLPENVFTKRIDLLDEIWLKPIRIAVRRHL